MIPDVSDALIDWTQALKLKVWTKSASDYQASVVYGTPEYFEGLLEPMPQSRLMVKPEGQRSWQWWMLYTVKELVLGAEVIDPQGRLYKVMGSEDWPSVKIYELQQKPQ